MSRNSLVWSLVGALPLALVGSAFAVGPVPRVSASQKGSVLIFSKIEVKWNDDGDVIQDTFLDISNDAPFDVYVQCYLINGDTELEERCSGEPCDYDPEEGNLIQAFEPGWNTADCQFPMTPDEPAYWSAARGANPGEPGCSGLAEELDIDGPGRPDPEQGMMGHVLRAFMICYAQQFFPDAPDTNDRGAFLEVHFNHLKGDAVIVNYDNATAWEYNAWAFRAIDHDGVGFNDPTGTPAVLNFDGNEYEVSFDTLLLDFYGTGSTALSGGGETVTTDTDLTVHAVNADLRQDGCGPPLTKVVAEIWNEFETKFSGTRRCVCCWDQTLLSQWVRSSAIPNHFKQTALRTDKGKARLEGQQSIECDDYEGFCGETAALKRRFCGGVAMPLLRGSEDASLLGLATKFLSFDPSDNLATAGMNLVGMGEESAIIHTELQLGPTLLQDSLGGEGRPSGVKTSGVKVPTGTREGTVRGR